MARPAGGPARAPRGRYAVRRERRQSRVARPAPQAWPGWQGWPKRRRTGRRRGRPHSPHIVGAGPRRSTDAATGEGEERGKAREAARLRAWPCGAEGCPRATEAANLPGPGLPGLGRHITRTAAGRPGGRRHRRRTGWAGCRPAGRRGGWDVARRTGPRTGAPFPGRYPAERTKRGSAHRALPLVC